MAHLKALRAASNAILATHVLKTLFALVLLGPFGLDLARTAQSGDLIRALSTAFSRAPSQFAAAQWTVCAYVLAGPLLTQVVLAALARRAHGYVAAGSRYARALVLSILRFVAIGTVAAGAFALSSTLPTVVEPALECFARLTPLALAAVVIAWLATAHDLAAASLAASEPPRLLHALACGVRRASPSMLLVQCGLGTAALLAFALGDLVARGLAWPMATLAVTQTAALAATFIHAWWLAIALTKTDQPF